MLNAAHCQAQLGRSGNFRDHTCWCKFHQADNPKDLRDLVCVLPGMQVIYDYFPWEHLFIAPAEIYHDFYFGREGGRIYFPLILPEIVDVYEHSSKSGWAVFEAVWYHLSGIPVRVSPKSSNQVLHAGADTI